MREAEAERARWRWKHFRMALGPSQEEVIGKLGNRKATLMIWFSWAQMLLGNMLPPDCHHLSFTKEEAREEHWEGENKWETLCTSLQLGLCHVDLLFWTHAKLLGKKTTDKFYLQVWGFKIMKTYSRTVCLQPFRSLRLGREEEEEFLWRKVFKMGIFYLDTGDSF